MSRPVTTASAPTPATPAETAGRVTPNGTRLLFLLDHTTAPDRPTAHATVTDLLTGRRTGQGAPLTPDPLGVAVPRIQ
ncbi:hypothetical protein RKD26_001305 [Streptomyces calvus]|uniref:Beta-galactosidase C-terminal domain n=1 Tax=Streptomyces calvus TaxID=67282 RepID=UPI00351363B4